MEFIVIGDDQIRSRYLNYETAVKVAYALVRSRLDYCNSLLYHTKKAYTDYKELKMPYVALCAD